MSISDAINQYQAISEKLAGTLGEEAQKQAISEAEELTKNPNLSHRLRESLQRRVDELKAKGL